MKIVSVILARGGSKGIPYKNILLLNNKPLIYYSINESLKSKVDETWISSDSEEIKKTSLYYNAKVLDRPKELATDTSSSEESLLHFIDNVECDLIVFIQPTSPMLKYENINKGIEMVKNGNFDSVFSCHHQHWIPEWSTDLNPLNFKLNNGYSRRQDKESKLIDIGMFYVFKRDNFLKHKFRLHGNIGYVEIPLCDSFQIDSYDDLKLVEKLMK